MRYLPITFLGFVILSTLLAPARAAICDNFPVRMPDKEWCNYLTRIPFVNQSDPNRRVDARVKEAMNLRKTEDSKIRSYAFFISVARYKFDNADQTELEGVTKERGEILKFLREQGFDEAVVLTDEEANPDTIRRLFTEYFLPKFASDSSLGQQIRFMFIFDGHGWRPQSEEATGALALSTLEADGDLKYDHRFSLSELRGLLQDLSPYTRSMMALLGSCYSGSVFTGKAFGEDIDGPAAWIATAVPKWEEAFVFEDKTGTVFFKDLLSVVRNWEGARSTLDPSDSASVIDFGRLTPSLNDVLTKINRDHQAADVSQAKPLTHQPYPKFTADTVAYDGKRNSAYRFVAADTTVRTASINFSQLAFTGSAVVGRPDLAVAHLPASYLVQGVDLSRHSGEVDFQALKAANLQFVYLKATQGNRGKDTAFPGYLQNATRANLQTGAYHFFDYCAPAEPQFALLKSYVPRDERLLPIAVDVEWMADTPGHQKRLTDCTSIATAKAELKKLLLLIKDHYGKTPVIATAPAFVKSYPIIDNGFKMFSLWIMDYKAKSRLAGRPRSISNNPWTLWQSRYDATFPNIPGKEFDLDIFFGSSEEFAKFASDGGNSALLAAMPFPESQPTP